MKAPTLSLEHVADFYRRYPGEYLTFFTRVQVPRASQEFTITIELSGSLVIEKYWASENYGGHVPQVAQTEGMQYLIWRMLPSEHAAQVFEIYTQVQLAATITEKTVMSRAWINPGNASASSVEVLVVPQGRYLQYLPAIYADDEIMSRLLMLFESFWKPISQQINNIAYYFDPNLAPPHFLPWLAKWLNLTLDERWPETKRRALLADASQLYRQRGTRAALQDYLEVYTGSSPQITEHGSNNMRLGSQARLGPGVALGTINKPHSFTVILRLPPLPVHLPEAERERLEQERQRTITAIIEAEKPAHTTYTLRLETVDVARQTPAEVAAL